MKQILVLILVAALSHAMPATAQTPIVGVLSIGAPEQGAVMLDQIFGGGLRKLGYQTGKTLIVDYRWAYGDVGNYPKLAQDLMARKPSVIVAPCGPSLKAIRDLSKTVPVIVNCADEKNFLGEIASLSRPGGYTTGVTFLSPESVAKRLELLREVVPGLSRLAILYQPSDPIDAHWRELARLQPVLGLVLQRVQVESDADIDRGFEAMTRGRAQAVFVFPTNRIISSRVLIGELARRHRVPSVFELDVHVDAGGLLSYGGSMREWMGETTPSYVDKILKGAKPGDLPVVQPKRFELVLNAKTAREIGVKLPPSLVARADRVID